MKKWKPSKLLAFVGLILVLLCTYFRENFLLTINALLASKTYSSAYAYWLSDFCSTMPATQLMQWKWGLTIFFSIAIAGITLLSLYCWFKSYKLLKTAIWFYAVLFLGVGLLALVGVLTHSFDAIYFVLRKALGVVQSPLPLFVFFAFFYWRTTAPD